MDVIPEEFRDPPRDLGGNWKELPDGFFELRLSFSFPVPLPL